jgi:hypothetical protein
MSISFACDMAAIPPEERGAHHALIRRLMPEAAEEYDAVTQFVARERLDRLTVWAAVALRRWHHARAG